MGKLKITAIVAGAILYGSSFAVLVGFMILIASTLIQGGGMVPEFVIVLVLAIVITMTPILCHWAATTGSRHHNSAARFCVTASFLIWFAVSCPFIVNGGGNQLAIQMAGVTGVVMAVIHLVYFITSYPKFFSPSKLQFLQVTLALLILALVFGGVASEAHRRDQQKSEKPSNANR